MGNIKQKLLDDPLLPLRVGLGIVFLLAGIHRIVLFELARANFIDLGLQPASLWVIVAIAAELVAGILFIVNRYMVKACLLIIAVMVIGIGASILRAGSTLWANINEVFMLTYTPTDIVLHISYLVGIITVLLWAIKRKTLILKK